MQNKQKMLLRVMFLITILMFILRIVLQSDILNVVTKIMFAVVMFYSYHIYKVIDTKSANLYRLVGTIGIISAILAVVTMVIGK